MLELLRRCFDRPKPRVERRLAAIEELEPRILYSAELNPALMIDVGVAEVRTIEPEPAAPLPAQTDEQRRREIVFVDAAVIDAQTLIDDIVAQRGDELDIEIVRLRADADGLQQIAAVLAGEQGVDAVHVVSHGGPGALQLGNSWVDSQALVNSGSGFEVWRRAMSADADVLLYGCNVAEGQTGREFVQLLAQATGADVAASDDATGNARPGADWVLESNTGQVQARTLIAADSNQAWSGLLAITANGTTSSASTDGATSLTWSHTVVGGSNTALFVTLAIDGLGATSSGVTYAGQAMTLVGRTTGNHAVEIWLLKSPPVGTGNVVASFAGTTPAAGGAVAYDGVDQSTPTGTYAGAAGTGTTASVVVSSAAGELVIDAQNWRGGAGGYAMGSGQSLVWSTANATNAGRSTTEAGAASVTMSSSVTASAQWETGAVSIKAAVNEAPVVTSNGGGAAAAVSVAENATAVTTVTATDADLPAQTLVYSIVGGADAARFTIDGSTGVLSFVAAPDFEAPADANADNVYQLTVQVSDGALTDTQALTVAVLNNPGALTVDTGNDVADGDTSSIAALLANKGADGQISLREAIIAANNTPNDGTADQIGFNIAGAGVHTINLAAALPAIIDAVVIDGTTQAGYSAGSPMIVLDGSGAGADANGLTLQASNSTIRGLQIQGFVNGSSAVTGAAILIDGSAGGGDNNTISGNVLTLNSQTAGGGVGAIAIVGASDNNLITTNWLIDNNADGIRFVDAAGSGNQITHNTISGSGDDGVKLSGANITFTGNTVSGNQRLSVGAAAVEVASVSGISLIANNTITNDGAHGSEGGIWILGSSGVTVADNTVQGLSGSGIAIDAASSGITLTRNAVYDNGRLGIDLMPAGPADPVDGVTANDAGDGDAGANQLLNFPVLGAATVDTATQTTVSGSFDGVAAVRNYRIEFFASASGDASLHGEGQRYLGFVDVATDASGHATFNVVLAAGVVAGETISATATDLVANETSEFSAHIVVTNTAPVLAGGSSPTLAAINEDAGAPAGAVGTLVSSLVDFALPAGQVDNVTDPDTSALLGIAITAADTSNGSWWFSTNGGASWSALGVVSDASSRLLAADSNTRLVFQPNANYNGTLANAITFRAWDQTSGANGGNADTSSNGGMTAFSANTDTASLTVNAVNDAPVLGSANLTVSEGQTVNLAPANFGITDPDNASFTYTVSGLSGGLFQLSSAPGVAITTFSSAQLSGGLVQFVDDGDEVAPSFSITVNDGTASSNTLAATITYTPVNEAPVITSDGGGGNAALNVAENTTAVTTVNASDVDLGSTLTYSIAGGADAARFTVDPGTGVLSFVVAPDFEAPADAGNNNVYDVTVQVSDGTLTDTQAIAVTVTAVNDNAPVINSNGGGASVALGAAENTTAVTTVTASDADAGSSLTYSIAGGADAARFTIDPGTGVLSFVAAPDFEAPADAGANNVYDVIVQVSDGALSDSQAIAVSVSNANEAPVQTVPGAQSVAEDGTLAIGGLSVNDPDNNLTSVRLTVTQGNVAVSLAGGAAISAGANNSASLTLTGSLGQINAALATLGYAPNADYNGADTLSMLSTDASGLTDSDNVAITVNPVNDAPVLTSATLTLAEGQTATLAPANFGVTDVDSASFTYAISGLSGGIFQLSSAPGVAITTFSSAQLSGGLVQFVDDGDEVAPSFSVTASDATASSNTLAATVTYTPVNEAPVIVSNGGGAGAAIGSAENTVGVTTVTATDLDAFSTLSYAIAGGADAARFAINPTTGVLTFVSAPDYEAPADAGADNVYDVVVQVSDGALTDTQAIAVTVTAVNDNAPVINSNGGGAAAAVSVAENATAVTTVTAADADLPGQTLVYSIVGGADAARFTIDGSTGVLSFVAAPDFEAPADAGANNVYDVIVQVSDGTLSDTQAIAVTVTPTNDNAPVITSNGGGSNAALGVAENTTAVATVTASDADAGSSLTYSIAGGADAARFTIDPGTGVLGFVAAPDFEAPADAGANNVYDVTVQVSDGTLTDTQAIAVTVTAVNDNTPAIGSNGGGANAVVNVVENISAVTTVMASDADAGSTLTYTIVGGADAARFTINPGTGALTFAAAPDFDAPGDVGADNVYDVTVQASDGTLSDTQAIAVTVTPTNDNAPVITSNGGGGTAAVSVVENTTAVTTVAGTDADAGSTLTYTIAGGADAARFTINPTTGALTFAAAHDFETPVDAGADNVYDVIVQVSDGTLSDTQSIAITVTNANEAPLNAVPGAQTVAEDGVIAISGVSVSDVDDNLSTVRLMVGQGTVSVSLAGGAAISAGANNSASLTLTGSLGQINAALATLGYTPNADYNGADTLSMLSTDASGSTDSDTVAIDVTAVNDAPVMTSFAGVPFVSFGLPENQAAVANPAAVDADGDPLVFSIVGGGDAVRFTIDASTGALSFIAAPDFDVPGDAGGDNAYDVTVQASDGSLADTQAIRVLVGNLNEAPTAINVAGGSVIEHAANGAVVATVTAVDPDAGDLFSFSLVSDAGGRFTIDPASGRLLVADSNALDFASAAQHTVIVRVTDAAGLTHQQAVVVQLLPNQPPPEVPPAPAVPTTPPAPPVEGPPSPSGAAPTPAPAPAPAAAPVSNGGGSTLPPALDPGSGRGGASDESSDTSSARSDGLARRPLRLREQEPVDYTLSFALLSPEELQASLAAAEQEQSQRRDALQRQPFGLPRGQAVQVDAPPADVRQSNPAESLLQVVADPVKVSGVAFTAGFVWWLTRGGGLLATMLLGIPAWRHIDLLPVLARPLDDEDEDDDDFNLLAATTQPSRLDSVASLGLREAVLSSQFDTARVEFDGSDVGGLFETPKTRTTAGDR